MTKSSEIELCACIRVSPFNVAIVGKSATFALLSALINLHFCATCAYFFALLFGGCFGKPKANSRHCQRKFGFVLLTKQNLTSKFCQIRGNKARIERMKNCATFARCLLFAIAAFNFNIEIFAALFVALVPETPAFAKCKAANLRRLQFALSSASAKKARFEIGAFCAQRKASKAQCANKQATDGAKSCSNPRQSVCVLRSNSNLQLAAKKNGQKSDFRAKRDTRKQSGSDAKSQYSNSLSFARLCLACVLRPTIR